MSSLARQADGNRRLAGVGLALAGVLLVGANLRPALTSVGPVIDDIQVSASISSAEASLLITLPLICFAASSTFAPRLAAHIPVRVLLAASLLALSIGIVLRSIPENSLLWIGSVVIGVAIGIVNVLLPVLVKAEFPERIGSVTGLYSAVQGGVAALASGLAVPIAGRDGDDWRLAIGFWAGLALIGFAVLVAQHGRLALAGPTDVPPPRHRGFFWRSLLAWQVTFFMACTSIVFYAFVAWLPAIAQEEGFSDGAGGLQLFVLQMAAIFASLAAAALIERRPTQSRLGVTIAVLHVISVLGLLTAPDLAFLWAALAGLGAGAGIVLALSLFGLRTRNERDAASLSGMTQCIAYSIAAMGPLLLGILHDSTGSWTAPLLVLLAVGLVQLPLAHLAGRPLFVADGAASP